VNTVLKEINKAKREAIKDEMVDSDAALEAKLQAVLSSNDKINSAQRMLLNGVDRKCAALPTPPDAIFAGECSEGDPSLSEVEACVIAAARCEACVMINAFDDLNLNCDRADDQTANGSCPMRAVGSGAAGGSGGLTNADCFDFQTCAAESTNTWATACCSMAKANPDMLFTPADYQGMPDDCKPLVNPICR
jgi:hypothetical protein